MFTEREVIRLKELSGELTHLGVDGMIFTRLPEYTGAQRPSSSLQLLYRCRPHQCTCLLHKQCPINHNCLAIASTMTHIAIAMMRIDVVTAERERLGDPVLLLVTQSHPSTTTVSSPTPQDSAQSRSTPPNWQEAVEEHLTAAITTTIAATPTMSPLPADEFPDHQISGP
jgi:hypothetical protein